MYFVVLQGEYKEKKQIYIYICKERRKKCSEAYISQWMKQIDLEKEKKKSKIFI